MSSTHAPDDVDGNISMTVNALASASRLSTRQLASRVGLNRATLQRKINDGGWSATEVARIALSLGYPVDDFYTGLGGKLKAAEIPGNRENTHE